ncbi:MAG: signal peptidase I [Acidimicrobiales bacterium]
MIDDEIAPSPMVTDENSSAGSPPRRRWFRRHPGHRPPPPRRSKRRALIETVIGLLVALLLALGVRAFAFQVFFVPSGSMEPTLVNGDRIVVDKFLFDYHSVRPGAIVVFRTPERAKTDCATEDGDLVKRVVAIGGETISSKDGNVYVDGKLQKESYLPPKTPLGQPISAQTVPKGDVFVLGDNRAISCDSRVWGPLPGKNIVGTVVAIVWKGWHPDVHFF